MTELRGKNVLITGAASGIGRLMAEKTAARGASVVLWDVNEAGLQSVREALDKRGHSVSVYTCDLSSRAEIVASAAAVLADHGTVDVLINNAGIVTGKALLDASEEDIERTFRVNTLAHFWTTRAFLPSMLEQHRGHVVTVASAGGLVGTPRMTDYCASKFAAVGFDEALRMELRVQDSNVRTTVVCPFYINTGMFEGVRTRLPWLLPILEADGVANRVVDAIERNRRRLIMPRFVYTTFLIRLLPVPLFDVLMEFFGVSKSMEEFEGRQAT